MNLKQLSAGVLAVIAASLPIATNSVSANEESVTIVSATCNTNPSPRTAYILSNGRHANLIDWQSKYFEGSGFSPLTRCKRVSAILKDLIESDKGLYIVEGSRNRHRVLCFSDRIGGECKAQFFTLKPTDNATKVLNDIVNIDMEKIDNPGVLQGSALTRTNFARLRYKK